MFHKDATDKESKTLRFVTISWLIVTIRYLLGGLDLDFIQVSPTTANEYGLAVGLILGIWVGREWVKKDKADPT